MNKENPKDWRSSNRLNTVIGNERFSPAENKRTLVFEAQILGTIQHGNSFFVRLNVDNHEIELPITGEDFHKLPLVDAKLILQTK